MFIWISSQHLVWSCGWCCCWWLWVVVVVCCCMAHWEFPEGPKINISNSHQPNTCNMWLDRRFISLSHTQSHTPSSPLGDSWTRHWLLNQMSCCCSVRRASHARCLNPSLHVLANVWPARSTFTPPGHTHTRTHTHAHTHADSLCSLAAHAATQGGSYARHHQLSDISQLFISHQKVSSFTFVWLLSKSLENFNERRGEQRRLDSRGQ